MTAQPHDPTDAGNYDQDGNLIDPRDDELERQMAFNRGVHEELRRLRIRDEARRQWELERHPLEDYAKLYLDADELDQLPAAQPLIHGVLNRESYVILRGRDHTFKSFVALDWSWCLATGKRWQARDVEQVRVLYIVGEGAYGIHQRKQAWEAAWRTPIPAGQWVMRRQALDMHHGGPPLDELLERVHTGRFGLVVVDTLRKVSGRADGNGSDMGAVVDNLTRLREATDNGSVVVLAHTDKNDVDTRGYSGIEDDADIVWHAKRPHDAPPLALDLVNTKMKDGPDGERIELTMSPVLDSLVVSKYARHGQVAPSETYDADEALLTAMHETFATTGASTRQLIDVTELPSSTVYKARGRLLKSGQLVTRKKGGTDYLFLVGAPVAAAPGADSQGAGQGVESGVESPWNRTPDSTAFHTPVESPSTPTPEHDSTAFHTPPHPIPHDSTPPPPVLETGVAWKPWNENGTTEEAS